ncbi:MAG TPA: metallophosphoesterase [Candidatus Binatia bacterium]|jgi:hypothetical protein|nr:metallophosphoesterase [Candidatus Binatia bacterium]
MAETVTLAILSDIHYASAAEQARGNDYEIRGLANPMLRALVRFHRRYLWLREPLHQNHLLDRFLQQAGEPDYVIANGDYSCNSVFIGVSDEAACQSAKACLEQLRARFGARLQAIYGDHELGKISFFGGYGGMRLASWERARQELKLEPFWQLTLGNYVLMGVVSSLVGLPVFEADTLPEERAQWERLRAGHMAEISRAFGALSPEQRVLLFCHDPTALPFLWREEAVRAKLPQIEQTVIGHLHSNLILWKSRWLAGMPRICFLGHTVRRLSAALREARHWRPFKVRLCPALAGIQLLKDGGYLTAKLNLEAREPVKFQLHRLEGEG